MELVTRLPLGDLLVFAFVVAIAAGAFLGASLADTAALSPLTT